MQQAVNRLVCILLHQILHTRYKHNDYYVSKNILGFLGESNNVNSVQTATTKDANSVSTDPYFVIHRITSTSTPFFLFNRIKGSKHWSVTTDFDGNLRFGATGYSGSGTAQDIGADEFEGVAQQGNDVAVSSLDDPANGSKTCKLKIYTESIIPEPCTTTIK